MIRLTPREEELMHILWKLEKAFVKEIMVHLKPPVPPYNTVLSMVRKLEKMGYVAFKVFGKTHQYYPIISKRAYQRSVLKHLVSNFFSGSPEQLLSFFIKEENLSEEEIKAIIDEAQNKKS
jgi:BlaI family penicillinase repressor